jgi:dipeptidyl aminopeptidase/acylaminoacyl peptidase
LPKILALHGTADPVVAFEADDALVRHLQSLGFPAQLVAFEGVRHSIAPAMRERVGATLSDVLRAAGRGR